MEKPCQSSTVQYSTVRVRLPLEPGQLRPFFLVRPARSPPSCVAWRPACPAECHHTCVGATHCRRARADWADWSGRVVSVSQRCLALPCASRPAGQPASQLGASDRASEGVCGKKKKPKVGRGIGWASVRAHAAVTSRLSSSSSSSSRRRGRECSPASTCAHTSPHLAWAWPGLGIADQMSERWDAWALGPSVSRSFPQHGLSAHHAKAWAWAWAPPFELGA